MIAWSFRVSMPWAMRGAQAATHLVFKLFLIWAVIIAVMTLTALTQ